MPLELGEWKFRFYNEISGTELQNHCSLASLTPYGSVQMNDCLSLEVPVLNESASLCSRFERRFF